MSFCRLRLRVLPFRYRCPQRTNRQVSTKLFKPRVERMAGNLPQGSSLREDNKANIFTSMRKSGQVQPAGRIANWFFPPAGWGFLTYPCLDIFCVIVYVQLTFLREAPPAECALAADEVPAKPGNSNPKPRVEFWCVQLRTYPTRRKVWLWSGHCSFCLAPRPG